MTARNETLVLAARLAIPFEAANTLRRASMVLHRWGEQECGDGNDYASWAIERDEVTGKPFRCWYPHKGAASRTPVADREAGALRRIRQVCAAHGLTYYHQGDPRGCALYVSREPITDTNYTNGVAVCA